MKKTNLLLLVIATAFVTYGFISQTQKSPASKPPTGTNIGNLAPDLAFNGPDGKPVTLSSMKGKLVLIDFWASWCRPCRIENPNVVSAYKKYKTAKFKNGKSFTILGVSLDMQKDAWVRAIKQDSLTWPHMSDLLGWNSSAASTYGVRGIPTNFLVDGKGIIIATNLRGPALDAELEKYVLR